VAASGRDRAQAQRRRAGYPGGHASPAALHRSALLRHADRHLRHLFPHLPGQSGYNKRLRGAAELIRHAIRAMACDTTLWSDEVGDRLHPGGVWPLTGDRQALGAGRVSAVWLLR
jgi:hypothetical protein